MHVSHLGRKIKTIMYNLIHGEGSLPKTMQKSASVAGDIRLDSETGKFYKCINDSVAVANPTSDFELFSMKETSDKVESLYKNYDEVNGVWNTVGGYTDSLPLPLDRYKKFVFIVGYYNGTSFQYQDSFEYTLSQMQGMIARSTDAGMHIIMSYFTGSYVGIKNLDIANGKFEIGAKLGGATIASVIAYK